MSKTNKKALVQEAVVRRWGKLANIHPLTETFLDGNELYEEEEVVGVEDEVATELPGPEAEEAAPEEAEAVEAIVTAVVDAISAETGIDIEVEGEVDAEGGELPGGDEEVEDVEMEVGEEDVAAMRDPYNRKDITETGAKRTGASAGDDSKTHPGDKDYTTKRGTKIKTGKDKGELADEDPSKGEERKGERGEGGARRAYDANRKDETLNLEVIDDEALTEAVLKRVVERLLSRQ